MQLGLDMARNRVVVNGASCVGSRRWEAALLHLLVQSAGHQAGGLTAKALNDALWRAAGQSMLTRKQVSRLFDSLEALFSRVGMAAELTKRLQVAPRQRTVGPWRWLPQPGDDCSSVPADWPHATPAAATRWPGFLRGGSLQDQVRICRQVLVVQALFHEGHLAQAATELADAGCWQHETPELAAWRLCRLAEAHWKLRAPAAAEAAIKGAEQCLHDDWLTAELLGDSIRLLRPRAAYTLDPVRGAAVAWPLVQPLQRGLRQQDRLHTGLAHNLAGLCLRRDGEARLRDGDAQAGRQALAQAVRAHLAALYCFATVEHMALAQSTTANLAHLLGIMFTQGAGAGLADVMAWFALAQAWHNRFELHDTSVWESIFLGDLWLYNPAARTAFTALDQRSGWEGLMPDSLLFYTKSAGRADEIGDPRQRAHCLLNLAAFAQQAGEVAIGAQALHSLQGLLQSDPALQTLLLAEGYRLPGLRPSH